MADKVMRMKLPVNEIPNFNNKKKKDALQRKTGNLNNQAGSLSLDMNSLNASSGRPLDSSSRAFMEPRFGHDFSRVKIHTDRDAAQMNKQINAQAFTYGNNIYFDEGKFNPASDHGKYLLAHELTHVVQQNDGKIHRKTNPEKFKPAVTSPGDESVLTGNIDEEAYYAIDADGDQVKELVLIIRKSKTTLNGFNFRLYHIQTKELSPEFVFESPYFDIENFSFTTVERTNGKTNTVIYISSGERYIDPVSQKPAMRENHKLTFTPPTSGKPGYYVFYSGNQLLSYQFKKINKINPDLNVALDTSTASAVGFASVELYLGPYYDRFKLIAVNDSEEDYTRQTGPYSVGLQLAGLNYDGTHVTFKPLYIKLNKIPSQLFFTEVSSDYARSDIDLDGDGIADITLRCKITQRIHGAKAIDQRKIFVYAGGSAVGADKVIGVAEFFGSKFYGSSVNDFESYKRVSATQSVTDLKNTDVPNTLEEEIGEYSGYAVTLFDELINQKGIPVNRNTYNAWMKLSGAMLQLLEIYSKIQEDTEQKDAIIEYVAQLADDYFKMLQEETKNEYEAEIDYSSDTMSGSTSYYNPYTDETKTYGLFRDNTFAGRPLSWYIRQHDWQGVSREYYGYFERFVKWISHQAGKPDEETTKKLEQLKQVSTMLGNIHNLYNNPNVKYLSHVKAVFYNWDEQKSEQDKKVIGVPLPMYTYYDTKDKEWVIIDYIKKDNPYYVTESAVEPDPASGIPEPPASLFKQLDDRDHLPEGYMVYELSSGTGGTITYTEPWEYSDILAAVGLGLAAVAIGAVTFGSGTVAILGGYLFVASAVASAASAVADLVDKSEHGQLTEMIVIMDSLQIVTSILQIKLSFAGMGKVLTNTTKFATTAKIASFFNGYYVPLKIVSATAEATQFLVMTADAVSKIMEIMNAPGDDSNKKRALLILVSQLTVTGGIYLLGLRGDLSDIKGGRPLFIDEFTGTDGLTKSMLAHFDARYAGFAETVLGGSFSPETFIKQFGLHFPDQEAALTSLLGAKFLSQSGKDTVMEELFNYIRAANPEADDIGNLILSLSKHKNENSLLDSIQSVSNIRKSLEEFGVPVVKNNESIEARTAEIEGLKKDFDDFVKKPLNLSGGPNLGLGLTGAFFASINLVGASKVIYRMVKIGLIQASITLDELIIYLKSIKRPGLSNLDFNDVNVRKLLQEALNDATFVGYSADEISEVLRYRSLNPNSELANFDIVKRLREGEIITDKGTFKYAANKIDLDADKSPKQALDAVPNIVLTDVQKAELDALKKQRQAVILERKAAIKERDLHAGTKKYDEKNYPVVVASEKLGEISTEIYMRAKGARKMFPPPGMASPGAGYVDQVWELGGKIYIIEIKGGTSQLGSRVVKYATASKWFGKRVEQGTRPYLEDVLESMNTFGNTETKKIAKELKDNLDNNNVIYQLIRQKVEFDPAGGLVPIEIRNFLF